MQDNDVGSGAQGCIGKRGVDELIVTDACNLHAGVRTWVVLGQPSPLPASPQQASRQRAQHTQQRRPGTEGRWREFAVEMQVAGALAF